MFDRDLLPPSPSPQIERDKYIRTVCVVVGGGGVQMIDHEVLGNKDGSTREPEQRVATMKGLGRRREGAGLEREGER